MSKEELEQAAEMAKKQMENLSPDLVDEAIQAIFEGQSLRHLIKRDMTSCGAGCSGGGGGCG